MNILESPKKNLSETITKNENIEQLHLLNEEEHRQLESNRRYWAKRLIELGGEIKTEPDRIRALYQVRAQRIEAVGLVYLWLARNQNKTRLISVRRLGENYSRIEETATPRTTVSFVSCHVPVMGQDVFDGNSFSEIPFREA